MSDPADAMPDVAAIRDELGRLEQERVEILLRALALASELLEVYRRREHALLEALRSLERTHEARG